jgi:ribose transport system substrate-binding protein
MVKKVLLILFCIALVVGMLGCTKKGADAPATEGTVPAGESEGSQASEGPEGSQASEGPETSGTPEVAPIYTYKDDLALGGVLPPSLPSRAHIYKALPTKKYETITVGAALNSTSSAYFAGIVDSVKKRCDEYGFKCTALVCEFDTQKQGDHIDQFIMEKVDVVILDPADVGTAKLYTAKCVEAGIPVICSGEMLAEDAQNVTTVMPNAYEAAFDIGVLVAETMKGKPIIASTGLGKMGSITSESHMNGYIGGIIFARSKHYGKPMVKEDAMMAGMKVWEEIRKRGKANYPELDFNIVACNGDGQWTEAGGMAAAEDMMLASNGTLNVMLMDNDFMALGAVRALEQMGYKCGGEDGVQLVGSGDAYGPSLKAIKEGKILATTYGPPTVLGRGAVDLAKKIFIDGYDANNMPAATCIPIITITAENVDEYYDPNLTFAKDIDFDFYTIDDYNAGRGLKRLH